MDFDSELQRAVEHLMNADERLAKVIERIGPPQMSRGGDAWGSLSRAIIGQQISVHAARAIAGRFAALGAPNSYPAPVQVLALDEETLRGVGLSRAKQAALRDLSAHFEDGRISDLKLQAMDSEECIQALVGVRGIGRWTAEMYLLFGLGRLDVWAIDDLGLRNGVRQLLELDERPGAQAMREAGEKWRPYRGVASWYLWRSLDAVPKIDKGNASA
jgi:DNA-3-methyladenine glycosylase II